MDNILANNLWILLSSVEMVAVARLWSTLHIAIIMPIRWLAGKVHKLEEYGWGPITLGKVLDKLKDDLESLIDQTDLIHDELFMMGIMDQWANELKPFREYMKHAFEKKKPILFADTGATAVPLKEMRREIFHPTDKDNKDSTPLTRDPHGNSCTSLDR